MTPNEIEETGAATAVADEPTAHEHTHDHDHDHGHSHGPTLNPALTRELAIEVPAPEVSKAYSKTIKQYTKQARIPGFRAGKVPESLIRNKFAKELRQEVMEQLVQSRFASEMESQALKPISQPQIIEMNLHDGQPLRFRVQFEVAPEIDLAGYESVSVEKPDTALVEGEFENELDRVLDSHATVETVEEDRELADGDWAEINFHGVKRALAQTVGEEGLESAEDADNEVDGEDVLVQIGGKNTLPAFTEALRGRKKGDELSVEVAYPKEFGDERLAGTTVDYDVTVGAIKKKTQPERDAEFAKQIGNHETWEEFENGLRESLVSRKKQAVEGSAKSKLVEALAAKFEFPVPESFVQSQIDARLDRGLRALLQQGMPEEQLRQMDFARLRDAQRDEAVKEVKSSLILDKLAEELKIEVPEDNVQRELMMMSLQAREPLEQVRERLLNDGTLTRIREQMRREAAATALYEKMA